jgi:hypothetical protein
VAPDSARAGAEPSVSSTHFVLRRRAVRRVPGQELFNAGQIEETADGSGRGARGKAGERSKASLKGASRQMVDSMSERQLREFAGTKRKGLPRKKAG